MRFSVLSSGSRANCTFVEAAGKRLLIDCGLSAKQTEIRLHRLGIPAESLDAIIVSHEHSDHIKGLSVLSRRYSLPIMASEATSEFISNVYHIEHIQAGVPFSVGDVEISPFQVVHDAVDPVAFVIRAEGLKFGQATDLGKTTPLVRDSLKDLDALVVESNHDNELLRECEYPWVLKQRIASSHGHLSNESCAELLDEVSHHDLQFIVLAHLSENSNTPDLALNAAIKGVSRLTNSSYLRYFPLIECGRPTKETPLYRVGEESAMNVRIQSGGA